MGVTLLGFFKCHTHAARIPPVCYVCTVYTIPFTTVRRLTALYRTVNVFFSKFQTQTSYAPVQRQFYSADDPVRVLYAIFYDTTLPNVSEPKKERPPP